jgi:hypothetical protein
MLQVLTDLSLYVFGRRAFEPFEAVDEVQIADGAQGAVLSAFTVLPVLAEAEIGGSAAGRSGASQSRNCIHQAVAAEVLRQVARTYACAVDDGPIAVPSAVAD